MAGDWIKVEKLTPDKPEIAILASKLGVSHGDAFLSVFRLYAWADGITSDGFVPFLSPENGDSLSRCCPGTCVALASKEIGWLSCDENGLQFSNWERHNSSSAKARCMERDKKRRQRSDGKRMSRNCPDANGTTSGLEKRREENTPCSPPGDVLASPGEDDADRALRLQYQRQREAAIASGIPLPPDERGPQ